MLARVDLYLELELATAISLRGEPEYEVHRVSDLLLLGFPSQERAWRTPSIVVPIGSA